MDKITNIVNDFKNKEGIDFSLSFVMPAGFENAFGTFDIEKNTLFINLEKQVDEVRLVFTTFHELRHALQYLKPQIFSKEVQISKNYVIGYDGHCWKLVDGKWRVCKLEGYDFLSHYLSLPAERDANDYAFKMSCLMLGESDQLLRIYAQTQPEKLIVDFLKIFSEIDEKSC